MKLNLIVLVSILVLTTGRPVRKRGNRFGKNSDINALLPLFKRNSNTSSNEAPFLTTLGASEQDDLEDFTESLNRIGINPIEIDDSVLNKRYEYFHAHAANMKAFYEKHPNTKVQLRHNWLSMLSGREFQGMNGYKPLPNISSVRNTSRGLDEIQGNLPSSFDWREYGVVGNVTNQGACGSCWAISTTETLASMYAVSGIDAEKNQSGVLYDLSSQQLVSCATSNGLSGCLGGNPYWVWDGGYESYITTEDAYPYTSSSGDQGVCDTSQTTNGILKGTNPIYLQDMDNAASDWEIMRYLNSKGPLSVAVAASGASFQYYDKGILTRDECSGTLDHAVQLVGYDSQDGVDYWIVRNSWGPNWGIDGYVYIQRDDTFSYYQDNGQLARGPCGINTQVTFPGNIDLSPSCSGEHKAACEKRGVSTSVVAHYECCSGCSVSVPVILSMAVLSYSLFM